MPGAKATLRVGAIDLDVSFSRDSGYFTLNFPIKYFDHEATLIIEHPNYEIYRDIIQLSQQTAFKRISHLKAKPLGIDWLIRETVIVATDEYAGGFNPFKYELNYLKLFDMFFKDRLYDPAAEFVWIFSGGAYVTRRSDITYAQVGGSWKPFGRYQKPRFSVDFAAGWAWLEDDIDDSKPNSPHLQIGISKYFQYSEFTPMAKPHIRTEITGFKENHEWRFLWSVGVGL